ncbi:cystathionine beta-synthase [Marinitoga sp. 1135]|uniref:PLP-dependent cysteine synthase family protein n=1 Tax=Marinitoga sp. 1135 TaxID=1643333 RepID=UPI00158675FA|nr:cysteine synthase family protein [Marinitoga sp. 1135]NUU95731.1 cystathionine beta-synthase [Marinitoga sp. 1135]
MKKNKEIYNEILELMGETPVIRLKNIEEYFNVKNELYAKVEYFNPGGSIKDRVGAYMLQMAEKENLITTDTVIIEPTSGNTGIGLALYAVKKGNSVIFIMPQKISMEKELLLRAYGAYIIRVPGNVSPFSIMSQYKIAEIIRNIIWEKRKPLSKSEIEGIVSYIQILINQNNEKELKKIFEKAVDPNNYAFIPNQYFNKNNPKAHYRTTAPELWKQFNGELDYIFAGLGTGGTISGIGKYFKERKDIKLIGVDPEGSIYHHVKAGLTVEEALKHSHSYLVEGIGKNIIPKTINLDIIDDIVVINDQEAFSMARFLSKREGILVGGSSGAALFGMIKYLKENNIKNKKAVVIFPDSGRSYLTKFFNDEWMKDNNLEVNDEIILRKLFDECKI